MVTRIALLLFLGWLPALSGPALERGPDLDPTGTPGIAQRGPELDPSGTPGALERGPDLDPTGSAGLGATQESID